MYAHFTRSNVFANSGEVFVDFFYDNFGILAR